VPVGVSKKEINRKAHETAPERTAMQNIRELYHSPNGDRWHLVRDPDTGHVFVEHQANLPSGGHVDEIEIGEFLNQGHGPEHQELLRLIGTLVDEAAPSREARQIPSTEPSKRNLPPAPSGRGRGANSTPIGRR
jgi:hypothetical protein